MAYSTRVALPFCIVLYLGSVVPLVFTAGSFGLKSAFEDQIQLAPAFAFTYLFAMVMRQQQLQRARAEALVVEIEEAHSQLRAYADQVEELTITRERNRMAREIHDTLGHYLTVLAVQLETALKLEERRDAGLHGELIEARRVASECLAEVRRSVAALRPVDPTGASFEGALGRLVAEFQATAPEAEVALDVDGEAQSLAPELRLALYRCAQEALTNVRKHAEAGKVLVRVRVDACAAELTVLDNGQGTGSSADGHSPGYGLLGISERIALLGGTARASAEPGRGWRVEVRVPLGEGVPVAS
jgi:signal transduction histidine kinase